MQRISPASPPPESWLSDEEGDEELMALRRAALNSRKRKLPSSNSSRTKSADVSWKKPSRKEGEVKPRAQDRLGPRPVQSQPVRSTMSNKHSSNSSDSKAASKYADLNWEELQQAYRASKRKRFRWSFLLWIWHFIAYVFRGTRPCGLKKTKLCRNSVLLFLYTLLIELQKETTSW